MEYWDRIRTNPIRCLLERSPGSTKEQNPANFGAVTTLGDRPTSGSFAGGRSSQWQSQADADPRLARKGTTEAWPRRICSPSLRQHPPPRWEAIADCAVSGPL